MILIELHLHLVRLSDAYVPSDLQEFIHTLMPMAAMQGADQHIRSSFGVQYLAKGHFNMQTRGIEPATFQ